MPPGATQLFVEVGAKGFEGGPSRGFATDSGFNGGGQSCGGAGNGGGASDVRTLPRTDIRTLNSRLLIAGGGGGAGSGFPRQGRVAPPAFPTAIMAGARHTRNRRRGWLSHRRRTRRLRK